MVEEGGKGEGQGDKKGVERACAIEQANSWKQAVGNTKDRLMRATTKEKYQDGGPRNRELEIEREEGGFEAKRRTLADEEGSGRKETRRLRREEAEVQTESDGQGSRWASKAIVNFCWSD